MPNEWEDARFGYTAPGRGSGQGIIDYLTVTATPEPPPILLLGAGARLVGRRRASR